MKYIFRCEKLIRDHIPELMSQPDTILDVVTLDHAAHVEALKKKLQEEALEVVLASTKMEVMEEIADVKEVLDALMKKLDISPDELEEIKLAKNTKKGGFNKGVYLKTMTLPKDSDIAKRFLKEPHKYPRIYG